MKFYSTNNPDQFVDLTTAVMSSLPPDNGLYMPAEIPTLTPSVIASLPGMGMQQIAYEVASPYLREDFSEDQIASIISRIDFDAPLVSLDYNLHLLELWHGPSMAFKDFGARFMAAVMSELTTKSDSKLTILVATSGDTGGAVASGFLGEENVEVIILYPSGKVSPLQEKQLTTLGQNIKAVEINGSFDDCQAIVKKAFLDPELRQRYNLSSANSINIARLIPQAFYYFRAYAQLETKEELVFCVPSGNFGNLTAGLLAQLMGLPIKHIIAAVNANDVIPRYLDTGSYEPMPTIQTISNAMDVGDPSNFKRMHHLFNGEVETMRDYITAYSISDDRASEMLKQTALSSGYIMDPHTAVGCIAADQYLQNHEDDQVIVLSTAHPAKFLPVIEPLLGALQLPEELEELMSREKLAVAMNADYQEFKDWMLVSC